MTGQLHEERTDKVGVTSGLDAVMASLKPMVWGAQNARLVATLDLYGIQWFC